MGITFESIFKEENINEALEHLHGKKDSAGIDGMKLSELDNYWEINRNEILTRICRGEYEPGIVQEVEIITANGKRRMISKIISLDRLILRCITQELRRQVEVNFSPNSFAYQEGKGTLEAAKQVVKYMNEGYEWCAEIDVVNYFDNINQERMLSLLYEYVSDEKILLLLERYLRCYVNRYGKMEQKLQGVLQGSPLSPLLSNLYLDEFDQKMLAEGERICRFADNINIYAKSVAEANVKYQKIVDMMAQYKLPINVKKSGVFYGPRRRYLGFCFEKNDKGGYLAKKNKPLAEQYNHWKTTAIQRIDQNYHIINDGILTRKDFTILFENESGYV